MEQTIKVKNSPGEYPDRTDEQRLLNKHQTLYTIAINENGSPVITHVETPPFTMVNDNYYYLFDEIDGVEYVVISNNGEDATDVKRLG